MFETAVAWVVTNAEKIGVLGIVGVIAVGWWFEGIILGKTHNRLVADKDKEILRLEERVSLADARSERLLSQLEKLTHIAEDASTVATTVVRRTDLHPGDNRQHPERRRS